MAARTRASRRTPSTNGRRHARRRARLARSRSIRTRPPASTPITGPPIVPTTPRTRGLGCWPGSKSTAPPEMNLAALLFDVARRQPRSPAVSDGVHAWSYGEFARRISCLGGGLVARGLEPGDRVMLCMENCAEFLEMLFACWTAGLCAVPVNARLHADEAEHIARDSRARLIVATPGLAEKLGPLER